MIANTPDPRERLGELRDSARDMARRAEIEGDAHLAERKKQSVLLSVDRFFVEIESALGQAESMVGRPDVN